MGCDPEKAIERQKESGWVTYRVWDILEHNGTDVRNLPLRGRRGLVREAVQYWLAKAPSAKGYVEVVDYYEDKESLLNTVLKAGGEGIVLKHLDSPYVENERNREHWMKVKFEVTHDVVIMGYEEPKQYTVKVGSTKPTLSKLWVNKWIGTVIFGAYDKKGELVRMGCCSGMVDKIRKDISEHKEQYLGRVIEVKGQCVTEAGAIQNPRFVGLRTDKDAKDCLLPKEDK